jgi:hypothetical protein
MKYSVWYNFSYYTNNVMTFVVIQGEEGYEMLFQI